MSSLIVNDNLIINTKGLQLSCYNISDHKHIEITVASKSQETDVISDIALAENSKHLALITSTSKQLLVYDLPLTGQHKSFILPRSASKIRFTVNHEQILVADKSGDVLLYNIKEDDDAGSKLLGHLSLLLDILQTRDEKYIITSDRDEKIRVSFYPNTYNIQTYCLGHKEFVNHMELLPHDSSYLTSTSGDGHIKCWDYVKGKLCYDIDTHVDVNDTKLKESFSKAMDSEGIEVDTLPIVHYTVTKLDATSSLLAIAIYSYNNLLFYKLKSGQNQFSHILLGKLELKEFPSAIMLHKSTLFIYNSNENTVMVYNILEENESFNYKERNKIKIFENVDTNVKDYNQEYIKVLYKRKFDNVQEYQERKRQRLEKSEKIITVSETLNCR